MAFTVETGVGLAAANSYASVAEADAIMEQHPDLKSWKCLSEQEREVTLRFATSWLDEKYRFFGAQFNPGVQALQWPRTKTCDNLGNEIAAGTIPAILKRAATLLGLELAKASTLASGAEDLTSSIDASGSIKSFQIETLAITFDQGAASAGGGIMREFLGKRFPQIELLLSSLGELRGMNDLLEQL